MLCCCSEVGANKQDEINTNVKSMLPGTEMLKCSLKDVVCLLEQQQSEWLHQLEATRALSISGFALACLTLVLGAAGQAVTQQGLDTRCELWLDQVFGLKLDFAIENSLPVCLEDGVIERDAQVMPALTFTGPLECEYTCCYSYILCLTLSLSSS